ncbi:apolipoprotein N-acyltransferase [Thalassotalea ganghwensis]
MKNLFAKLLSAASHFKQYRVDFLLGASLVFAYAPFSQWWLVLIVFPCWLHWLTKAKTGRAFLHGFYFGFGWFLAGISWVFVCIDRFGGVPIAVSIMLTMFLAAYLALFPALASYLSSRFAHKPNYNFWLLPASWLVVEWLRARLLTGFPWLSIGYSQIDGPLAAFAPIVGEVGISFLVIFVSVLIANLVGKTYQRRSAILLISTGVVTVLVQLINPLVARDKTINVALIQGNIQQELKWQPEQQWPTMMKYLTLTRQSYPADLVIWPESAITGIEPLLTTQEFLDIADASASVNNSAIITGILNYNFDTKESFNSLIVLGKRTPADDTGSYFYNHSNRYYKHHLLPIGEFVPFGDILRPLAPLFNLAQSSFTRGAYQQENLVAQGLNILPMICFEIAFPEQLAANFTDKTNMILTVSNDAWFGDSHGPHQHLEIARMRAKEFGRPVLRATNTGVTAVIDSHGKIIDILPQFKQAVLKAEVELTQGMTVYQHIAPFAVWLMLVPYLIMLYLAQRLSR